MLEKIKQNIEAQLRAYLAQINKTYNFCDTSPLLFNTLREFILRRGKRLRPTLFVLGYKGFRVKEAPGLYQGAIAFELLHDYMLVHDDIIDKSRTRRGKPAVHARLEQYLSGFKNIKFNGRDLGMLVGDVCHSLAIRSFLCVREDARHKEKAFAAFIDAALYTGTGEFVELINSKTDIKKMSRADIYNVYCLKTAIYSFASPLYAGALLAGSGAPEAAKLYDYGILMGKAFQIKDDIIGTFGIEKETGKPNLSDLAEGKKTILIWYAFHNSGAGQKKALEKLLSKRNVTKKDLLLAQDIIRRSKALDRAQENINDLLYESSLILASSKMHPEYKDSLSSYAASLLN